MDPIRINDRVSVPSQALEVDFVRSSGPGGQNVNKVSSKVELRVDLAAVLGLTEAARQRLGALARRRDRQGRWILTSQKTRDQSRNLQDAVAKVRALVTLSLVAPKKRRPTRPSAGSVERRLAGKRRRSEKKRARHGSGDD
jgi:ribosome-associated protein